jgi:hypothetical protein
MLMGARDGAVDHAYSLSASVARCSNILRHALLLAHRQKRV